MLRIELICCTILGLAGIVYAYHSYHLKFAATDYLPERLRDRKVIFVAGFALVLLGFLTAYRIGEHHGFISLVGGWIMLLGSTPWFDKRICRKFFAPEELRVIRVTLFAGLLIAALSTGFLKFPPVFSPGAFLMGISLMLLAGRLWWNQDPSLQNQIMQQSKRNYS